MKKIFCGIVGLITLAVGVSLGAYDLNTPELVPVKLQTPEAHAPVKLIENGKLNFAIVYDTKAEQRMAKKNRTSKSIGPAVAAIADAIEKCTGQKPVIAEMKGTIASALDMNPDQISVKATTTEKLGFEGREEGVSAYALCTVQSYG